MLEKSKRWWEKGLQNLTADQWELLCDGCGLCCLHKLEDEETGALHYTQLACPLLDTQSCQCRFYAQRFKHVPECMKITPSNYREALPWLPNSCAYKRVAQRLPLPSWHHLLTGERSTIHDVGASVRGRVRSSEGIEEEDYQEYILHWIDADNDNDSVRE